MYGLGCFQNGEKPMSGQLILLSQISRLFSIISAGIRFLSLPFPSLSLLSLPFSSLPFPSLPFPSFPFPSFPFHFLPLPFPSFPFLSLPFLSLPFPSPFPFLSLTLSFSKYSVCRVFSPHLFHNDRQAAGQSHKISLHQNEIYGSNTSGGIPTGRCVES